MDLSQNENRKLILPILFFLLVLALGILVSVLYFQRKNAKIQSQVNSAQQPQNKSLPVPSNVTEPSKSPDIIPPSDKEEIPVPSNVVEPPNEEKTPVPPNITEPSNLPDIPPSSKNGKMPPPLP